MILNIHLFYIYIIIMVHFVEIVEHVSQNTFSGYNFKVIHQQNHDAQGRWPHQVVNIYENVMGKFI